MPANTAPIFPLTVRTAAVSIVPADGTGVKTLLTAGANGTRVDLIAVTSTDTVQRSLAVFLHDGTTSFRVGTVAVGALAGAAPGSLTVSLLGSTALPWEAAGIPLFLASGWSIKVATTETVTTAKEIHAVATAGDY